MHKNVLNDNQIKLLPLVKELSTDFGLVGGTAIALHLGHRRSIDFDLFTTKGIDSIMLRNTIRNAYSIQTVLIENSNELTLVVNDVKMTFYKYPFNIEYSLAFENGIKLPDIVTLASMKAFALGNRAKWKDYVDLYYIFKTYPLQSVIDQSNIIFKGEFNTRLFREQLAYFEDIDYTESVEYISGFEVKDKLDRDFLIETSLQE